ncbi:hypothetical protein GCM10027569_02240 [Flindersiella endophytica]
MLRPAGAVLLTAAALSALTALAGCGSADLPTADPTSGRTTSASPSRTASPTRTPTATATATPTATPTPTQKPRPKPKDGTNLDACYDGSCEVLVTKPVTIRLDGKLGVPELPVENIGPDGVDFPIVLPDGTSVGMLGQRPDQGGPSGVNKLRVWVVWLGKDSAVIRLAPA